MWRFLIKILKKKEIWWTTPWKIKMTWNLLIKILKKSDMNKDYWNKSECWRYIWLFCFSKMVGFWSLSLNFLWFLSRAWAGNLSLCTQIDEEKSTFLSHYGGKLIYQPSSYIWIESYFLFAWFILFLFLFIVGPANAQYLHWLHQPKPQPNPMKNNNDLWNL